MAKKEPTKRTRTRLVRGEHFCGWKWLPKGSTLNKYSGLIMFHKTKPRVDPYGYPGEWVRVGLVKVKLPGQG